MEHLMNSTHSFNNRSQSKCKELNSTINKLIEDLGQKIQKNLIYMQEKVLLDFKDNLIAAQKNYRQLKKDRNEEVIKQKILNLKTEKEKIFAQQQIKSSETNKVYDKLKLDLKSSSEYEHELQLEIKYLTKQCMLARKKGESLDQEIKEHQNTLIKRRTSKIEQNHSTYILPSIRSKKPATKSSDFQTTNKTIAQRRIKVKKQSLKQFMQLIDSQQTQMQKIVGKYDIQGYRNEWQKINLIQKIIGDVDFKKFIYKVLFNKTTTNKQNYH